MFFCNGRLGRNTQESILDTGHEENTTADAGEDKGARGGGRCNRGHGAGRRRRRGRALKVLIVFGILTGAVALGTAIANAGPGSRFRGDAISPEKARAKATFVIDRMMDKLDGDDAQRAAMEKIADTRMSELLNIKNEMRALKTQMITVIGAGEKPDLKQLAQLRVELVGVMDRGSQTLLTTFSEVSETLTPAQWKKIRGYMSWWLDD
ncbi:MAG: hypothetical protein ACI9MR_001267 [Myxococcota bacterium]